MPLHTPLPEARVRLPEAPRYLLALSGGADSRLLLALAVRLLADRVPPDGMANVLHAAHLHHGIRGEEADRDEAFCRAICDGYGVPLHVRRADVPSLARKSGTSLETAGREARYAFFEEVMAAEGIPLLLTAHHADDGLETLLGHFLRGSGTRGMGGIPPYRLLGTHLQDGTPMAVARPLYALTRREILGACERLGLDYVTDSTNDEDDATRNRLRHTVIPALEAITGPDLPQRAALRLSEAAREDDDALTSLAAARYEAALDKDTGHLPVSAIAAEHPAIGKRILLLARTAAWPSAPSPAACHLEDIYALCRQAKEGSVSSLLPGGDRAAVRGGMLVFERPPRATIPVAPLPDGTPRPLGEGLTLWAASDTTDEDYTAETPPPPAVHILLEVLPDGAMPRTAADDLDDGAENSEVFASAVFPADSLSLPLFARTRLPGDIILCHGMQKKLKKLICDKGIDPSLRSRLPLVCLADGTPLWYPGVAFRDGFPAPTNGPALRITILLTPNTHCHLKGI